METDAARLCENVWTQNPGASLQQAMDLAPANISMKHPPHFVHVVNPYAGISGSEGDKVQRLTFETMRRSKLGYEAVYANQTTRFFNLFSKNKLRPGRVTHVAATYIEDVDYAQIFFSKIEPLTRSATDIGKFGVPRKLPLLFDILSAGRKHADKNSFMVMTNCDICLCMGFYDAVAAMIRLGYDAILINRRTIEKFPFNSELSPIMSASIGDCHPGFDCFVFSAKLFDEFIPATSVIGRGCVMRSLLYNLVAKSKRMIILKDAHLTFHIGDDRPWSGDENSDYVAHNLNESAKVLTLSSSGEREKLKEFCVNHGEYFGNHAEFPPPAMR